MFLRWRLDRVVMVVPPSVVPPVKLDTKVLSSKVPPPGKLAAPEDEADACDPKPPPP